MQPEVDLPVTHFYTDFIIAGQDAFSLVVSLVNYMERTQN